MIALIPGSFDPITLGHVDVIERAAKKFDKVFVAVMNNDSAKHFKGLCSKTYMFDMQERTELVRLSVAHIENVEVVSSAGLVASLFDELCADVHTTPPHSQTPAVSLGCVLGQITLLGKSLCLSSGTKPAPTSRLDT